MTNNRTRYVKRHIRCRTMCADGRTKYIWRSLTIKSSLNVPRIYECPIHLWFILFFIFFPHRAWICLHPYNTGVVMISFLFFIIIPFFSVRHENIVSTEGIYAQVRLPVAKTLRTYWNHKKKTFFCPTKCRTKTFVFTENYTRIIITVKYRRHVHTRYLVSSIGSYSCRRRL